MRLCEPSFCVWRESSVTPRHASAASGHGAERLARGRASEPETLIPRPFSTPTAGMRCEFRRDRHAGLRTSTYRRRLNTSRSPPPPRRGQRDPTPRGDDVLPDRELARDVCVVFKATSSEERPAQNGRRTKPSADSHRRRPDSRDRAGSTIGGGLPASQGACRFEPGSSCSSGSQWATYAPSASYLRASLARSKPRKPRGSAPTPAA